MTVDKFATHTCISRHTLCLITTQFTTDWRNRDAQRRFFVKPLNFHKRWKRFCLCSLLFLPHHDERWLHFPNCLALFITDCKRFGPPCRSSVFALVCGMIAILISIFKWYLKKLQILFVYIYNEINSRPKRHMRRKRSMLFQKRCCPFSGTH